MTEHLYGTSSFNFRLNDRVAFHPASDIWMSGDRYGIVTEILAYDMVRVETDSGESWLIGPQNIRRVADDTQS